jgi:Flp pilus assembly pilin Flp
MAPSLGWPRSIGAKSVKSLRALLRKTDGGSNAEYALILAILGTGLVLAALLLGDVAATATNEAGVCIETSGSSCS